MISKFSRFQLLFVMFAIIALGSAFFSNHAKAVSGPCYFGTDTCSVSGYGDYGTNDIFTVNGQGRYSDGSGLAIESAVNSNADFVNYIMDRWADGGKNKVGAGFIIDRMIGKKPNTNGTISLPSSADITSWKTLMANPLTTFWRGWDSTVGDTSYYDPGAKDDFFADHPSTGRTVIVIKYNAKLVLEIEVACGNALPDGAPFPNGDWNLVGFTTANKATAYPGDTIKYDHQVKNEDDVITKPKGTVSAFARGYVVRAGVRISQWDFDPPRCDWVNTTLSPNEFTPVCSRTDTVANDAQPGDLYCQLLYYAPTSTNNGRTSSSRPVCVTILGWTATPTSTVDGVQNKTVLVGQNVTFAHSLKNTGPNALNKAVDGNVWWSVDSNVSGADFPTCNTWVAPFATTASNCYAYRATDLDMPSGSAINTTKSTSKTYAFSKAGKYCEYVSYNPASANDFVAAATTNTPACVFVIDPTVSTPTAQEFEKGSADLATPVSYGASVADGGFCPPAGTTITFTVKFTISKPDNTEVQSGQQTITYGNADCSLTTYPIVLNASAKDALNAAAPGSLFPLKTMIVENSSSNSANITVIEVPFTRFYGNDVVSRAGDIRFNASNSFDSSVGGRGSVSQFGAFSTTAKQLLATAAFRFGQPAGSAPNYSPQTQPTDGLKTQLASAPATVSYMIDKLQLPSGCENIGAGDTLTAHSWGSLPAGVDKCFNITAPGPIDVTPTGAGPWGYQSKYTLRSQNNLYISKDFYNTTPVANYTSSSTTGVLLLITDGDIYIDKSVSRVDAILLAKGTIYTCAENSTTNVTTSNRSSSCRAKNLTINGSLAATNIRFERSVGSRLLSDENTQNGQAGIQNIAARTFTDSNGDGLNKASETVNFPAYLYFTHPYLKSTSKTSYDALFNAPPRL